MILSDVNVLVYAHRESAADHPRFRDWLTSVLESPEPFGVTDIVLTAFVRVVTWPRREGAPRLRAGAPARHLCTAGTHQ